MREAVKGSEKDRESEVKERDKDLCCEVVHEDDLSHVAETLPDDEELSSLADLFKIFSDPTRIKIMGMLSVSELCVCDMAELLGMNQPAVSNHLRVLRQSNLVKSRKEGKRVIYSLADGHVETILSQGLEHINE